MFDDGFPSIESDEEKRMTTYDVAELLEMSVLGKPNGSKPEAEAVPTAAEPAQEAATSEGESS